MPTRKLLRRITRNLYYPQGSILGRVTSKALVHFNDALEKRSVELLNLQPEHSVLEIGFGPGLGLKYALEALQFGSGKVYGVDHSEMMLKHAYKLLAPIISANHTKGKLRLFHASADNLPFNRNQLDKVFAVNVFHLWSISRPPSFDRVAHIRPNNNNTASSTSSVMMQLGKISYKSELEVVSDEMHRVLKPGGQFLAAFSFAHMRRLVKYGILPRDIADAISFISCLEASGFTNIQLDYHSRFETITAEKPLLTQLTA